MTADLLPKLFKMSFKIKQIPMEDAYIGILATALDSQYITLYDNYMFEKGYAYSELTRKEFKEFYFVLIYNLEEYFYVWNKYLVFPYLINTYIEEYYSDR